MMPVRKASDVPESGQPRKSFLRSDLSLSGRQTADRAGAAMVCNLCLPACNTFPIAAMVVLLLALASATGAAASDEARLAREAQRVVDGLRTRLGITASVAVTLVDRDPRVMSVRASRDVHGTFDLSIDRGFVAGLPAAQLEAALAHELGHVWISTHHPYLQTEQLANRVAMRAVPRARLVEVYRTLWGADALHGSLETFLGVEATVAAQQ